MIEQHYQSVITICERFKTDLNLTDMPIDERLNSVINRAVQLILMTDFIDDHLGNVIN